eukprot:1569851-Rhodomonas_salina.5
MRRDSGYFTCVEAVAVPFLARHLVCPRYVACFHDVSVAQSVSGPSKCGVGKPVVAAAVLLHHLEGLHHRCRPVRASILLLWRGNRNFHLRLSRRRRRLALDRSQIGTSVHDGRVRLGILTVLVEMVSHLAFFVCTQAARRCNMAQLPEVAHKVCHQPFEAADRPQHGLGRAVHEREPQLEPAGVRVGRVVVERVRKHGKERGLGAVQLHVGAAGSERQEGRGVLAVQELAVGPVQRAPQ